MHWNSNSINKASQLIEELEQFIHTNNIDIISINETKLNSSDQISIKNYNIIRKDRNSHGGGVAIIIHEELNYEQIDTFEEFDLELITIKVSINKLNYTFITLYLPPQTQLPNINKQIINLQIPQNELHSDHFPMIFEIDNTNVAAIKNKVINKIDIDLQNHLIEEKLKLYYKNNPNISDINTLNYILETTVELAKKEATKTITKKIDNLNLPRHILTIIKSKTVARKTAKQSPTELNKAHYNKLTKIVHDEIQAFKLNKLEKRCEKLAEMKASESKFWSELKKLENNNKKELNKIPYQLQNNVKIFNDTEKAELFASILSKIFTSYEDDIFDADHKSIIENFTNSNQLFNYESEQKYEEDFKMYEFEYVLKNIKERAPGPNVTKNNILKKIGPYGKLCKQWHLTQK